MDSFPALPPINVLPGDAMGGFAAPLRPLVYLEGGGWFKIIYFINFIENNSK